MTISKSERRIALVLGIIITVLQVMIVYQRPKVSNHPVPVNDIPDKDKHKTTEKKDSILLPLSSKVHISQHAIQAPIAGARDIDTVYFPNKMDSTQWRSLGFKSYVCGNIIKYRKAGGVFRHTQDLKKIYNIDTQLIHRYKSQFDYKLPATKIPKKNSQIKFLIDINKADTNELKQIYGIGPVLSKRIIKYRELLGGFHRTTQLLEVYGIDMELFNKNSQSFICTDDIEKIDLNNITEEELGIHPYFKGKVSTWIVNYRDQNGRFSELEELKKIKQISDSIFYQIKPYCMLE